MADNFDEECDERGWVEKDMKGIYLGDEDQNGTLGSGKDINDIDMSYDFPLQISSLNALSWKVLESTDAPSKKSTRRKNLATEVFQLSGVLSWYNDRSRFLDPTTNKHTLEFTEEVEVRFKNVLDACKSTLQRIYARNVSTAYQERIRPSAQAKTGARPSAMTFFRRRKELPEDPELDRDLPKLLDEVLMENISLRFVLLLCEVKASEADNLIEVREGIKQVSDLLQRLENMQRLEILMFGENRSVQTVEIGGVFSRSESAAEACTRLILALFSTLPKLCGLKVDDKDPEVANFNTRGADTRIFMVKLKLLLSVFKEERPESPPPAYEDLTMGPDSALAVWKANSKLRASLISKGIASAKDFLLPSALAAMLSAECDDAYRFVCEGADPNVKNKYGQTLLHIYSKLGDIEKVSYLLDCPNILVNPRDIVGKTPLHHACQQSAKSPNINVLVALLDRGACVSERDCNGWTPLHLLCWKENIGPTKDSFIQLLLSRGANVEDADSNLRNCLHTACIEGDILALKSLLGSNATKNLGLVDDEWCTPLHYAAKSRQVDTINSLFQHNINVNINSGDKNWRTPLHYAFMDTSSSAPNVEETAEELISRGARVDAKDVHGMIPLHYAAMNLGRYSAKFTRRFIERHGPDLDAMNHRGETALEIAVRHRNKNAVAALLECGATPTGRAYRAASDEWEEGYDEEVAEMIKQALKDR